MNILTREIPLWQHRAVAAIRSGIAREAAAVPIRDLWHVVLVGHYTDRLTARLAKFESRAMAETVAQDINEAARADRP